MRKLPFFLLFCAAHLASAQLTTLSQPAPAAPVTSPSSADNATPNALNGYVSDDTYKLRVGDTVSFQIQEDKIWNPSNAPINLLVEDSGEVDVPYIGRVMAVDKTSKHLAEEIKTALEKDYYNKATIVLSLNSANRIEGQVYIWGQVHNQGAIDLQVNENLTAGQAILRAGGFEDFADKRKVKVVRGNTGTNGDKQSFELDMTQILEQGKTEKDIVLQPNDLIIVPSRLVNF